MAYKAKKIYLKKLQLYLSDKNAIVIQMPKFPELPQQPPKVTFVPPPPEAVREAIRKMEQDIAKEMAKYRRKIPSWSPEMDQIRIGVPGMPSPEESRKR